MILQQIIKDEAINIKEWLIGIRRDFHQHPELSTEEMRTKKKDYRIPGANGDSL